MLQQPDHITILAKDVYGERKYYPMCEKAHLFAKIAGTKTLTKPVLKHILELGFELRYHQTQEELT